MKQDDENLMAMLARGEMEALREIYTLHSELVYRIAFRYTGNRADAMDITQALFADLPSFAHKYKPKAALSTWLYRVVSNRCINWTKSGERKFCTSLEASHLENSQGESRNKAVSEKDRPDEVLEKDRRAIEIRDAVASLPPRQKTAIILREFQGLSYKEIAAAMNCSRRSVESLLIRARAELAQKLGQRETKI